MVRARHHCIDGAIYDCRCGDLWIVIMKRFLLVLVAVTWAGLTEAAHHGCVCTPPPLAGYVGCFQPVPVMSPPYPVPGPARYLVETADAACWAAADAAAVRGLAW